MLSKYFWHALPRVLRFFQIAALLQGLAALALLGAPAVSSAALTDCEGMSIDGQAKCVAPTYAPTQFGACYIGASYLYKDNAMNACYSELGLPNPMLSESSAVALVDCYDKKMMAPSGGGVTGSVSWLPVGTAYNDNFCASGTVRDFESHHLWGVGTKSGSYQSYAITRAEPASCPSGYTGVNQLINGVSTLVRCKPNPPCPPDQVVSPSRPGVCDKVVVVPPPPCPHCHGGKGWKVGDPIYPLSGTVSEPLATGFKLNGAELVLSYNSIRKMDGVPVRSQPAFGALWSSSLHKTLGVGSGGTVLTFFRGDGRVVSFSYSGSTYVADANIKDSVVAISGAYYYADAATNQLETYNSTGQLTRIDGFDGAVLRFTYSAGASVKAPTAGYLMRVEDNAGRALNFTYMVPAGTSEALLPTSGLISGVSDAAGRSLAISYDSNLNLTSVTWPDTKTLQFLYEDTGLPWALTGRVDENGSRHATWSYDAQGRAISTSLAGGVDAYSVSYGSSPQYTVQETEDTVLNILYRRYQTVAASGISIDAPNGQSISWGSESVLGMAVPTAATQPAGSGSAASSSALVHDANGNLISSDDFQGVRTCYAYDASNRQVLRIEGLANTVACSSVLTPGPTLPAGARFISSTWHPDWRLPVKVTQPLRSSTTVYHGQPDPFNSNVTANCTTAPALPSGKPLPVVCKQVEQATTNSGTAIPDNFVDSVQLLLHGEGANGGTSIVDNSPNNFSPTTQTGVTTVTSDKKFGAASLSVPSGGLSYTGNAAFLYTGDVTIEGFYKLSSNLNVGFLNIRTTEAAGRVVAYTSSTGTLRFNRYGSAEVTINSSTSLVPAGTWFHFAFVRQGSTITYYINGVSAGSTTDGGTLGNGTGGIAVASAMPSGSLVDDFRVTKGVARYTANFTAPTQEFSHASAGSTVATSTTRYTYDVAGHPLSSVDPNGGTTTYAYYADTTLGPYDWDLDSVQLLLHGEGANGGTSIVDNSPNNLSPTTQAGVTTVTSDKKFGTASLSVPSGGLSYAGNAGFLITGDVTIEGFYKLSSNQSLNFFTLKTTEAADRVVAYTSSTGTLRFNRYGSGEVTINSSTSLVPVGAWFHFAFVRQGSTITYYINGVSAGSTADGGTLGNGTGGIFIADVAPSGTLVDDFRVTKGLARYTANFTAPTQQFSHATMSSTATGHMAGDLQSITTAAGHVTQFNLYDQAGRVRQMTDAKGIVTDITYKPRSWVESVSVTPSGGSARTATYTYDFAGQVTGVAMPDGTTLGYSYDAAHRLTGVTDARGNSVTYILDNVGNRTGEEVRDSGGTLRRSISRSFDALNRLQQATGAPR
ncbi:MAG: hypothetical protein JWQ07_121 [Ramlibacter sp.]|nr:hypothetical protein [Ramlibacter sp.]